VSDDDRTERIVTDIRSAGARAFTIRADASSEERVQAMFRRAIAEFVTIDILINNARLRQDAPFHETTLAQRKYRVDILPFWREELGIRPTKGTDAPSGTRSVA
jgi:NAD(P)-dependent dehydrogenase (short-subunit alcohol dehydrogenase family)